MDQCFFLIDGICKHLRHTKGTGFLVCCTRNPPALLTWQTILGEEPFLKKARDSGEAEERVEDVHHRGERGAWPSILVISSLGIEFRSLLGSRLLLGFRRNYHEYFTFLAGDGRISRVR